MIARLINAVSAGALIAAAAPAFAAQQQSGQTADGDAQDRVERAVEHCEQMSSTELRIACLEAALEAAYRNPVAAEARRARQAPPSQAVTSAGADSDFGRRDSGGGRDRGFLGLPRIFGGGEERTEVVRGEAAGESSASGLGAEQVAARNRTRADYDADQNRLTARIASVEEVGYRNLQVTLDNGMVWRQLQGDRQRISIPGADRRNLTVEIWESRLGGYQMRINEIARTVRVERVR